MNLIDLSKKHLLNETEYRILSYVLSEIEKGKNKINIRSIAKESYVSTTTVIKLAKKLGYEGYSDMIFSLKKRFKEERNNSAGIELSSILKVVDFQSINFFTKELFNHKEQCIYIVGLGFSSIASSYFVKRLATLGILAYDGSPVDMIRWNKEKSIIIILSKSGETQDFIDIATISKNMNHTLFVITSNVESTLAKMSNCLLTINTGSSTSYNIPDFFIGRTIILFEYILSQLVIYLKNE